MQDNQPLLSANRATNNDGQKSSKQRYQKLALALGTLALICLVAFVGSYLYEINSNGKSGSVPIYSRLSAEKIAAINADENLSDKAKQDLITELPGLSEDINDLKFSMFSGYLTVGKVEDTDVDKEIFYWFIEVEHEDDESVEESPLLLWTNGGPGCSGLVGLMTEHGAFWTTSSDSVEVNEYSWNKYANMLYIEQPYGVGFSEPYEGKIVYGDSDSAADMDALVREFLTQYPKFQSSDFYLSSESYGGHYMPRTALAVLQNNDAGYTPTVNLKGFLVGNPLTDAFENSMGFMEALYGHGLLPKDLYDDWTDLCSDNLPYIGSASCDLISTKAYIYASDVQFYGLDFPTCELTTPNYESTSTSSMGVYARRRSAGKTSTMINNGLWKEMQGRTMRLILDRRTNDELEISQEVREQIESQVGISSDTRGLGSQNQAYVACGDDYTAAYLNTDSVQTALHTKTTGWSMCNYEVNEAFPDSDYFDGMETVYATLVSDYSIKILVYSGDDDSVCSIQGTQYWMNNMDNWSADSKHDWKEWTYMDELAGFYTKYNTKEGNLAVHFQTVRSAGHMVPSTQPERALELLRKYLYEFESP